jgi:phosphohistidine phosphatase SixA
MTRDTEYDRLSKPRHPTPALNSDLYHFGDAKSVLTVIVRRGKNNRSLLVVGHSPILEDLVRVLVINGDRNLVSRS